MRRIPFVLVVPMLMMPLLAVPGAAEEPSKPEAVVPHHTRQSWEQHFTQANQTHDGHLTLDEAKAGFPLIAKHFNDIDVDRKGYVTANDIRAWRAMRKAAHRLSQPPMEKPKPRQAFLMKIPVTQQMLLARTVVPPNN